MAKLIISSILGNVTEAFFRGVPQRRRRKSKSRSAREHVRRLPGAWLMDVQDSYSDTAR